ncbi:MAG: UPF0179 family protein [Thermoplasmata archaeon]|nr:UPF0179 family protein [Thermoplasmata archaeon]
MTNLTVLGSMLAKKGSEIIFMGSLSECKGCKVKNICFHLDAGRHYRILGVRDVKHECDVFEDGVKVVEIEKIPFEAVMDKKKAIEGSTITFELPGCRERGCEHYLLCHPPGLTKKSKMKLMSCLEEVKCMVGSNRIKVTIE